MKFVLSYSGGKDSMLALYKMRQQGHEPVALVATVDAAAQRSWFHGVPIWLLQAAADSLQIPLLLCASTPADYTAALESSLRAARQLGATAAVFGDIDIADHQAWNAERCQNVGLECLLPLWQQPREQVVRELLAAGFQAVIKIVDGQRLDPSFLGQTLTTELLQKIQASGADVCGEYGEYHTFVFAGPLFKQPLAFRAGPALQLGTHWAIDLLPVDQPPEPGLLPAD